MWAGLMSGVAQYRPGPAPASEESINEKAEEMARKVGRAAGDAAAGTVSPTEQDEILPLIREYEENGKIYQETISVFDDLNAKREVKRYVPEQHYWVVDKITYMELGGAKQHVAEVRVGDRRRKAFRAAYDLAYAQELNRLKIALKDQDIKQQQVNEEKRFNDLVDREYR